MEPSQKILALVKLIDDPDESIFQHVRDELINEGEIVIPFLEDSWEHDQYGLLFQNRIEQIIHDIQFNQAKKDLLAWKESNDKNLLSGAITVAKIQYPNLNIDDITTTIQQIRKDIWVEFNDNQTAYEQIRIFNKVFFGKYGFTGNSSNYHSSDNSIISRVLETKKGNPLSLSVIYSIIAQSLDLPVYGVNLPNHFILAYMDENNLSQFLPITEEENYGVLFYINPFSKGSIFDANEIKEFMKGLDKEPTRSCFEPCSNTDIIIRMITNLIFSFQQAGNGERVRELVELRDLL